VTIRNQTRDPSPSLSMPWKNINSCCFRRDLYILYCSIGQIKKFCSDAPLLQKSKKSSKTLYIGKSGSFHFASASCGLPFDLEWIELECIIFCFSLCKFYILWYYRGNFTYSKGNYLFPFDYNGKYR
jgi:hypothetical protein